MKQISTVYTSRPHSNVHCIVAILSSRGEVIIWDYVPCRELSVYLFSEGPAIGITFRRTNGFFQLFSAPHARVDVVARRGTPVVVPVVKTVKMNLDLSQPHLLDGGRVEKAWLSSVSRFYLHPGLKEKASRVS